MLQLGVHLLRCPGLAPGWLTLAVYAWEAPRLLQLGVHLLRCPGLAPGWLTLAVYALRRNQRERPRAKPRASQTVWRCAG